VPGVRCQVSGARHLNMFFNIYGVELYENTIENTSMIVMKKIIAN
jgi:hypothetical protein